MIRNGQKASLEARGLLRRRVGTSYHGERSWYWGRWYHQARACSNGIGGWEAAAPFTVGDNRRIHLPPSLSSQAIFRAVPSRSFGLYRRPHQRNLREVSDAETYDEDPSLDQITTADDMETYDFFSGGFDPLEDDDVLRRDGGKNHGGDDRDEDGRLRADLEEERKAQTVRDELDRRTGRLWTDEWEITDQDWYDGKKWDDIPDWTPELCSRISKERVKVLEGGIWTLSDLATLPIPPPQPAHPSSADPKPYVNHAKSSIRAEIATAIEKAAADRVENILELTTWEEKQDAVDELFENVEEELRGSKDGRMSVLSAQPAFGNWVEGALEKYLITVEQKQKESKAENSSESLDEKQAATDKKVVPTWKQDHSSIPVFMDIIGASEEGDVGKIPSALSPLKSHHKEGTGRMVEEWDLAADKGTKRILIRHCIREIAQALEEAGKENADDAVRRMFVKGRQGVGKTAALAAIVASARKSGHIVMYLPDGDRLRKLGYYVRPNQHRGDEKLFDLPVIAKEVCRELLDSHQEDLEGMTVAFDVASQYLSPDNISRIFENEEDASPIDLAVVDLLEAGSESNTLSSGCYSAVVHSLMNQTEKPFVVVMDEFNCYFDYGHYYHEAYDPKVEFAIPPQKITLFRPLLGAMGLEKSETVKGLPVAVDPVCISRGAIVVGTTESRSVAGKFTSTLEAVLAEQEDSVKVVDVTAFSPLEVDHVLANYECIGIGRLRFDRGSTVMNEQEVAYLRMVSGGVGQKLLDASIV